MLYIQLPTSYLLQTGNSAGKESACNAGDSSLIPGVGRSPGGGHINPLQYSCLENPHGQRSLVGYSPCSYKELDMTEQLSTAQHSVYKSMLLSQFTPSSPSPVPTMSQVHSRHLHLYSCKWIHQYHFSRLHIHALIYDICFPLSDLLHSILHFMGNRWGNNENSVRLYFFGLQNH